MSEDLGTVSNTNHNWVRVEAHVLKTTLDEVEEEFLLRAQGRKQMKTGHVSGVYWTCINDTQQHHTSTTGVHNNQEAEDIVSCHRGDDLRTV